MVDALRQMADGMFQEGSSKTKAVAKTGAAAKLTNALITDAKEAVDALWKARGYVYPPRSAAAKHRLAAAERVLVSPCSPSHILSCAGRLEHAMSDFVTGQRPPSAPRTAPSASRRCARVRTHATGCRVRERRFGRAVHVVRGVWRRSWAQSLRGRRDACGGVRHAARGGHAGERGHAARDLPARCRPAGGWQDGRVGRLMVSFGVLLTL